MLVRLCSFRKADWAGVGQRSNEAPVAGVVLAQGTHGQGSGRKVYMYMSCHGSAGQPVLNRKRRYAASTSWLLHSRPG